MNFGEYAWRNGESVTFSDCNVHITTHALHYGSSVFEGIRAYATPDGPAVFRLEPHTRRMVNSCKLAKMDLPYSEEQINQAIVETIAKNGHESCYVRPLAFRGEGRGLEGRKFQAAGDFTLSGCAIWAARRSTTVLTCDALLAAMPPHGGELGQDWWPVYQQPIHHDGSPRQRVSRRARA